MEKLLDIEELSARLGVSVNTLYTWVNQRKIPYVKMGRLIKFESLDIENWTRAKRVEMKEINSS